MKTAIVTGASSGIGLEISKMLIQEGYKVFGIGRTFNDTFEHDNLIKIILDVTQTTKLIDFAKKINKENDIFLLVNNCGVGYYSLHEELSPDKISQMVRVNLETPMLLSSIFMRNLKKNKGTIINISSVTAKKSNTYGCCYGATKAGLTSFSESLFDENRKYGVKIITIHPDMTKTNLYRNANFKENNELDCHINPTEIAQTIKYILTLRDGIVITDITIKPQKHKIDRK